VSPADLQGRRSGEEGISVERIVGLLEGQLQGIRDSQIRMEANLKDHMDREELVLSDHSARLGKLEVGQAENKGNFKVLAAVASAASVGGASVKHLIEKILG
jgi:hypothetical protein